MLIGLKHVYDDDGNDHLEPFMQGTAEEWQRFYQSRMVEVDASIQPPEAYNRYDSYTQQEYEEFCKLMGDLKDEDFFEDDEDDYDDAYDDDLK